ncbi:hydrolase [Echinimonas agarilytica]|uniref:Hydrolase n=1 Tax=Echinimonas agarilytica TaxID=1215918 RepID=A0AA41W695_9GAMM|nr:hydrolase [Echinimonas agarilytica]MCM2679364.1 hydrolase [Echinimonas agarilytica]
MSDHMPISRFNPSIWVRNRHLQTIWSRLFPRKQLVSLKTWHIPSSDGEQLNLCIANNLPIESKGIVVLLHGLEGSAQSDYIQGMFQALIRHQFTPMVLEFRGCGSAQNLKERAYHSGETSDLSHVIEVIRAQHPTQSISAIGYSLGGNVLAKYLGEMGEQCHLSSAAIVSAPLDLAACAAQMNTFSASIYQSHLIDSMQQKLIDKLKRVEWQTFTPPSPNDILKLKSFWQFDNTITAPLHGFDDVHDYYTQSSAKQFLKAIHKPCLIIHAKDDPFMNEHVIPLKSELSASIEYSLQDYGGHVGFIKGSPWRPYYWLEHTVPNWIESQLCDVITS